MVYQVTVQRIIYCYASVTVEAISHEDAEDKAPRVALDVPNDEWDIPNRQEIDISNLSAVMCEES